MNIYQIIEAGKNPGVLPVASGGGDEPKPSDWNTKYDPWSIVEPGCFIICDNDDTVGLTIGEEYKVIKLDFTTRMVLINDDHGDYEWHPFFYFETE